MYILGMIILVFFAVIGLAAFIGALIRAHCICDTGGFILLIPRVDENNAEMRIRSALSVSESARVCRIICVCDENDPARMICEKMQRQFPQVEIVETIDSIYGK